MCWKTVFDDQSGNDETLFAEFRSCSRRLAQPETFAIGMQTGWKYAGPVPWIQLNAKNPISGTGSQCRRLQSIGVICSYDNDCYCKGMKENMKLICGL